MVFFIVMTVRVVSYSNWSHLSKYSYYCYDVMFSIFILCSFGAGQISVGRHMANIVALLGDANSQVE